MSQMNETGQEEKTSPVDAPYELQQSSSRSAKLKGYWKEYKNPIVVATFAGPLLAGALTAILTQNTVPQVSPGLAPVADATSHAASSSSTFPRATDLLLEPGTCIEHAKDILSQIACDRSHEAEVIGPSDNCTLDAAIHYLGGDPYLDVVSTSLKVTESEDSCILQVENEQISASFKDALFLSSGVTLRECFDKRSNQFVSCGENHTGEVVARVPADSVEPLDCEAKADQYMGQKFASRHDELTFDKILTSAAQRCVVSMRADNRWLDTSLRDLGTKALKTRPMD